MNTTPEASIPTRPGSGTFSVSVKTSAVTLIEGDIIELVRYAAYPSSEQVSRVADEPLVAGRGYAFVSASGRRLDPSTLVVPTDLYAPSRSRATSERRRAMCASYRRRCCSSVC